MKKDYEPPVLTAHDQLKQIGFSLPQTADVTQAQWKYTPGKTIIDNQGHTLRVPSAYQREAGDHTQTVTDKSDASEGYGTPPVNPSESGFLRGILRRRN